MKEVFGGMLKKGVVDQYLDAVVSSGVKSAVPSGWFKRYLRWYLEYLFQDVLSFTGQSMLDIGAGAGLYSLYAAYMGTDPVICLEPEAEGSTGDVLAKFRRIAEGLSLSNISALPVSFQEFDPGAQTFDIILLHNSINHLDEIAVINLQHSHEARTKYKSIFQKLSNLANPGARLIICDCSRYNIFALLHVKNPLAPTIEWHKHQSPRFWCGMLEEFNFANPKIRWSTPGIPRGIGRLLLGNRIAAHFLWSHFCLVMEKK